MGQSIKEYLLINPGYYNRKCHYTYPIQLPAENGIVEYYIPYPSIYIYDVVIYTFSYGHSSHQQQSTEVIVTDYVTISALIDVCGKLGYTIVEDPRNTLSEISIEYSNIIKRSFDIQLDKIATEPYSIYYAIENIKKNCGKKEAFLYACRHNSLDYVKSCIYSGNIDQSTICKGLVDASERNYTLIMSELYNSFTSFSDEKYSKMYKKIDNAIARHGNIEVLRIRNINMPQLVKVKDLNRRNYKMLEIALNNARYEFAVILHMYIEDNIEKVVTDALSTNIAYFDYLFIYRLVEPCIMFGAMLMRKDIEDLIRRYRNIMELYNIPNFSKWKEDEATYLMNKLIEFDICNRANSIFRFFSDILKYNKLQAVTYAAKKKKKDVFLHIASEMDDISIIPDQIIDKMDDIRETDDTDTCTYVPILKGRGFCFKIKDTELAFWLDRYTLHSTLKIQEEQDLRIWIAKPNNFIDDNGIGGYASDTKIFIIPPTFYINEESKDRLVKAKSGCFTLSIISHGIRIGNGRSCMGIGETHGQAPGVSFYHLEP